MTQSIILFHLSDIHFGIEDRRALAWAKHCITREAPDAVAITGDITQRAKHSEFAAAQSWIAALGPPVTLEVGNHDMPYYSPIERFTDPYRRFKKVERVVESPLNLGSLAMVPLRTTARAQFRFPWSDGWLMPAALAETLAVIDALPKATRVIVTAHHPLPERSPSGKLWTRGGDAALEEFAKRGVLAVLSGHTHVPMDELCHTPSGPVRMIGAGTLSQRIRGAAPSFNVLRVNGNDIAVEHRAIEVVPNS